MTETDLGLDDGSTLHVYAQETGRLAVFWLHGTPNIGLPPEPLFADAARLGLRWIGYDRPGYGGSTPRPGRDVASAAHDVARIADRLGIDRFAVVGHSGGGPHTKRRFRNSTRNRSSRPTGRRLRGRGRGSIVVAPALAAGPGGMIDDDVAYVSPWGFDCARITRPVLLLHGGPDRMVPKSHAEWLARRCPSAELWLQPEDGHLSILSAAPRALAWLKEHAGASSDF